MIDGGLLIPPSLTIRDAIDSLVKGGKKVVFITAEDMRLLGLFTNGDMRSILLKNTDFSRPVAEVMNPRPIVFSDATAAIDFSRGQRKLVVYPIVSEGYLVDAVFDDDPRLTQESYRALAGVPLAIIAGGKGTRLYPYTQILPKALIPIGEKTVTERIIQSFARYGCRDVYMVLNHKANMIRAYFSELKKDYRLHFAQEEKPRGTAGGLTLLRDELDRTFLVSNCDILIDDDLSCAYATHRLKGNAVTAVCSAKSLTLPYGVIHTDESGTILRMEEKPQLQYLVNTGVYVMEPETLDLIGEDEVLDMPTLIQRCIAAGMKAGVFPVSDRAWMDMGQFDTMNQMLEHFRAKERGFGDE